MALPKWNSEWEKPDPLRGGRGWARHHYATVGVAVVVFITAFGVLAPAIARLRQSDRVSNREYLRIQEVLTRAYVNEVDPGNRDGFRIKPTR